MTWKQIVDAKYNQMLVGPLTQIYLASQIEWPRCPTPPLAHGPKSFVRPVCFTDSSEIGGGYLLYLRFSFYSDRKQGMLHVPMLIKGNAKIHSIHYTSMPRGELSTLLFGIE